MQQLPLRLRRTERVGVEAAEADGERSESATARPRKLLLQERT